MSQTPPTRPPGPITLEADVVRAARELMLADRRRCLGIVGAPGAGKSTFAEALTAALGNRARIVPMDGFHLSNRQLTALGRAQRKGAPDTFDAWGYRALLERLRHAPLSSSSATPSEAVYAPGFYRELEEPVAASIAVEADVSLIVTEGNYLLLDDTPWPLIRESIDEIWFVALDRGLREERLVARHRRYGRSEREAREWVASTDAPNAARIESTAHAADRCLHWQGGHIAFAPE